MTERVLVQAGEAILDDLGDLAEHGVSIAIDDFGTGYASLAYLQRFPIDAVKIDRSFVAGLGHGTRDDAIVTAISALGAALGLRVVAEAVEHAEQVDRLCQMGCLLGQGFHFGRPCPPEAFAGVLSGPGAR